MHTKYARHSKKKDKKEKQGKNGVVFKNQLNYSAS